MTIKAIESELKQRIQSDIDHFDGELPENFAIAWRAYLAGLLEWGLLDVMTYDNLVEKVPAVPDDPAIAILRGRE